MWSFWITFSVLFLQLLQPCFSTADPTRIRLHKGWVHGNRHSVLEDIIVHEYLGIPMGKPPIGEKRFSRPEPVEEWTGDFNATKRSSACYNFLDPTFGDFEGSDMWNPKEKMSEDCLYINAWVPNPSDRTEKKPIMVWIYGGGFYSGSSTLDIYDGRYLAASQNVIVISMQYRLSIFGFLNLESELAPGNMGLLDQRLGLQWTQENAEYLNGDKNNVTIAGESAGSVSVNLHLISPKSQHLFSRAILQSGSATADWSFMSAESFWYRLNKTIYSREINCPVATTHVPTLMKCLLNVPAATLFENTWAPNGFAQFAWLPSIDYYFLYELPEVSLRSGNFKKCPILIGSNANEGSSFLIYELKEYGYGPNFQNKNLNFTIDYARHRQNVDKIFRYYPQWPQKTNQFGKDAILFRYTDWRSKDDSELNKHNLDMAAGDNHFLCPTNKLAHYYVIAGLPVYYYYYTHRSTRQPWGEWMGVMHGDEITFMFGVPLRPNSLYTDEEKELSSHMMELWSNFSKTGHPNGLDRTRDKQLMWPMRTELGKQYYEINIKSMNSRTYGSGPRTEYCAFWDNYLPGLIKGTANINDVEKEWKQKFAEWNTEHIVNWKHEYNTYIQSQYEETECAGKTKNQRDSNQRL